MSNDMPGHELAVRLFGAFRALVEEVDDELTRHGHAGVRPAHGFALQAIGPDGTTAGELARRLGVSKQAAGKTVDGLVERGLAERVRDPGDARRMIVTVSHGGREVLQLSEQAFARAREGWLARLGSDRLAAVEDGLRAVSAGAGARFDAASWFGSPAT